MKQFLTEDVADTCDLWLVTAWEVVVHILLVVLKCL